MDVRLVDAEKVKELKKQAIRRRSQNVPDTRLIGQAMEAVLKELDLWEEGRAEHEAAREANTGPEENYQESWS